MIQDRFVVAVTEAEYAKAQRVFDSAGDMFCVCVPQDEAALAQAVRGHKARHAVVGIEPYVDALYDALPKGGVLARFGVGYDGIDLDAATRAGILCTNTPGTLDTSVAEHAVALMLAAAHGVAAGDGALRRGDWRPRLGTELRGKRLAVIGCGSIGKQVARMAAVGFGMDVLGCDVRPLSADELRTEYGIGVFVRTVERALPGADFVSLHVPSLPETHHLIDAPLLDLIEPHAWLINTSRGALLDESALYDALAAGGVAGAALDVFENEPYVPIDPERDLRTLENVVLTPHIASSTQAACDRMAERALRNIRLALRGKTDAMDLLNPEVL